MQTLQAKPYRSIAERIKAMNDILDEMESRRKMERLAELFRQQGMTARAVKRDGQWITESDGTC